MTAPASILASFAQPASRLAMGDATGAALGGFEALLAMLSQSLESAGQGTGEKTAATGEPAPETSAETPANTGDLAALLAQAGPSAWLTQTLSQTPVSQAPVTEDAAAAPAPVTCAVPQAKSPLASAPTPVQANVGPTDLVDVDPDQTLPTPAEGSDTTALDALLRRHPPETVDPALLERIKPVKGQTAAQSLQGLLPTAPGSVEQAAVEQAVEAAVVAQVQAEASVRLTTDASSQTAAETVAAPIAIAPPVDAKAPTAPRKAAPAADGKIARVEKLDTEGEPAPVDTAEAAAVETAAADAAPVELAAQEAETSAPPARNAETAAQALAARLETVAAGATALAAQVRGAPETVAKLAAGIVSKLEGQSTRFDLQLDPHGLGKVDVSVEIASDGKLTAQLGFDSALGLSELRGRVQDLRTALEQAGFSLADNALSFDFSGERRQQQTADGQASNADLAGKAFARSLSALDEELAATPIRYQARRGLDLLI
jgi:flagellar hook-length control protein FliK